MDSTYGWNWKDIFQTLFYFVQACGVVVAIFIYRHQSRKLSASEKQANRARLTEAYMHWHHIVLGHEKNTALSGKMMRRGHVLVQNEHEEISEEMAREVHLLCLLLNTMFLEWNYRNTYDKKNETPEGYPALNATIDNLLTGLVINSHKHYTRMIDNFDMLFPDFPVEFRRLIVSRIAIIRKKHATAKDEMPARLSTTPSAPLS